MHLVPCGFGRDRLQLVGERGPDGLDELRPSPDEHESGRQRNDASDDGEDEGGEEDPTRSGHPNLVGQDRALIRHAGPEANRGERVEPGRHKILPRSPGHCGGPEYGGEGLTDLGGRAAPHGHVDFPEEDRGEGREGSQQGRPQPPQSG